MEEIYSFGYWVMRRRKALDLTRAELAQRASCSPETIKKIERDERRPSRQVAELLAAALAVPAEEREMFLQAARGERPVNRLTFTSQPPHSPTPHHNLPLQLTSFIGREAELDAIKTRLTDNKVRLMTIVGAGGVGKTRLALQAAGSLAKLYSEGVWLVDLAPLSDPSLVILAVASTLGVVEGRKRPLLDMLVHYLRERQILLLLDNCEHLVDAAAELAATLLMRCPGLQILATSHEPLGVAGETVWLAPTMSLPPLDGHSPSDITQFDAVRLFVDRATAALPAFKLTKDNTAAVLEVCRRLDGIPLAIELAAARVSLLRVEQIAAALDNRFNLLVGGNRAAPQRHQTLRALIDWSYKLLSPVDQRMLRGLSVFAGSFTLDAVEAVCCEEPYFVANDPRESLTRLVEKSLVAAERAPGKEARYFVHDTIRQYGVAALAKESAAKRIADRHATFYCQLAEATHPELYGAEQPAALERLETEYENLRAALSWSLASHAGNAEMGLRLAAALVYYWKIRGLTIEGTRWMNAALEKLDGAPLELRALVLLRAGELWFDFADGKDLQTTAYAEESLALYQQLEDPTGIAWAMYLRGKCALYVEGDLELAAHFLEQSLALAGELGDKALATWIFHALGFRALWSGDYLGAADLAEKGLALAREAGALRESAYHSFLFAESLGHLGQYDRAMALMQDCAAFCRRLKARLSEAQALNQLGEMARRQKLYDQAAAFYRASIGVATQVNGDNFQVIPLSNLGFVAIRQGDLQQASALFQQSMANAPLADVQAIILNLWGIGQVAEARGHKKSALILYAATQRLLENFPGGIIGKDREDFDRDISFAREQFSEEEAAAVWADGWNLSMEEAVEMSASLTATTLSSVKSL